MLQWLSDIFIRFKWLDMCSITFVLRSNIITCIYNKNHYIIATDRIISLYIWWAQNQVFSRNVLLWFLNIGVAYSSYLVHCFFDIHLLSSRNHIKFIIIFNKSIIHQHWINSSLYGLSIFHLEEIRWVQHPITSLFIPSLFGEFIQ